MLNAEHRSGWARLPAVLVHLAVLGSGVAGLAAFAVTMSEATPAPPDMVAVGRDERAELQSRPEPELVPVAERTRAVRIVYPGR